MSIFWIIYFVTLGSIILLICVIALLFDYDDGPISISYVVLAVILCAIPCVNFGCGLLIISLVVVSIVSEDLTPKF